MAFTKAQLEALKNSLLASNQPITASIHRSFAQKIIDELYDSQSRGNNLAGVQDTGTTATGDKLVVIRSGVAYLIPASEFGVGLSFEDLNGVVIIDPQDGDLLAYNAVTDVWENIPNVFVPYANATASVDLGEFGLRTGFIRFDTSPTGTPNAQGVVSWDAATETLALQMDGVTQHVGQDLFAYAKNSSGSLIVKGTPVRNSGTDGASGHKLIVPFLANGTHASETYLGVTAEDISNGGFGQVMQFGDLGGINTSGYTSGALLYVSTTVAGQFQTTVPVAPNNIILVGRAINSKNNGDIFIRPHIGSNIRNDEGVRIVSPVTGQTLIYNAVTGLWENGAASGSKWTDVGADIYRNSRVLVGHTAFNSADSVHEINHSTNDFLKGLVIVNRASWGWGSRITFQVPLTSGAGAPANAAAIQQGFESSGNFNLSFWTTNSSILSLKMLLSALGNLIIGGTGSDAGFRLDVFGTARIQNEVTLDTVNNAAGDVLLRGTGNKIVRRTPAQLFSDMGVETTGSFTPTLTAAGATYTIGSNDCVYVKIGKLVHFSIDISVSHTGTPTERLVIANFPFSTIASSGIGNKTQVNSLVISQFAGSNISASDITKLRAYSDTSGATFRIRFDLIDDDTFNGLTISFPGTGFIKISGSYISS